MTTPTHFPSMQAGGERSSRVGGFVRGLRAAAVSLVAVLGGCSVLDMRTPVPAALVATAHVPGLAHVRFFGDEVPADIGAAIRQRLPSLGRPTHPAIENGRPLVNFLALSGGGSDGAYGAGLLTGWTKAGTRPTFQYVTGISAGALIAPFAYLGPAYDRQLEEIWTHYGEDDLIEKRPLQVLFGGTALTDTSPLASLIARYIDRKLLAAVAAEYRKGRVLMIGTTNLDARRPVVWNMGEIALRGDDKALELFRKVLLASAAIPGVMPPVKITVEADGKSFDEYHVDGGVTRQVFLTPVALSLKDFDRFYPAPPLRRIYVIRNGRLKPLYKLSENDAVSLVTNSISVLLDAQASGDIYRIYTAALRDGAEFNLAANQSALDSPPDAVFDQEHMRKLFALARAQAASGYPWLKEVPEIRPNSKH